MSIDRLQRRLLEAARSAPPDDRVPYRFERRVMARLGESADSLSLWAAGLWRASGAFWGIAMLAAVLWISGRPDVPQQDRSLLLALEDTLWAPLDDPTDNSW